MNAPFILLIEMSFDSPYLCLSLCRCFEFFVMNPWSLGKKKQKEEGTTMKNTSTVTRFFDVTGSLYFILWPKMS